MIERYDTKPLEGGMVYIKLKCKHCLCRNIIPKVKYCLLVEWYCSYFKFPQYCSLAAEAHPVENESRLFSGWGLWEIRAKSACLQRDIV